MNDVGLNACATKCLQQSCKQYDNAVHLGVPRVGYKQDLVLVVQERMVGLAIVAVVGCSGDSSSSAKGSQFANSHLGYI